MYKLHYTPGAASLAVHWMLIELGVPFELERVDFARNEQKSPEYLKLNPAGQVPTLEIDGRPYVETAALLMILAERHPEHDFAPLPQEPERWDHLELMIFLANNLAPAFRALFYPEGFGSAEDEQHVKHYARQRIETAFSRLDQRLSDGRTYLLGERFTASDFLATMLARWSRNMPRPAETWPNLGVYIARVKQREGLREVHRREGLTDWINTG
jgi:glutathione S-transferase